jgi:hypothetical protein
MKHIARMSILVALFVAGVTGCGAKKPNAAAPTAPATEASESMAAPDKTSTSPMGGASPIDDKADPDDGGEVSPK